MTPAKLMQGGFESGKYFARSANRQAHLAYARGAKFVNDLRVVYEIQSRLQPEQEPANSPVVAPSPEQPSRAAKFESAAEDGAEFAARPHAGARRKHAGDAAAGILAARVDRVQYQELSMKCAVHAEVDANWLLPRIAARRYARECTREVRGALYCEACLAGMVAAAPGPATGQPVVKPDVNPGLARVLGFIPGLGAVYNGEYIKGADPRGDIRRNDRARYRATFPTGTSCSSPSRSAASIATCR